MTIFIGAKKEKRKDSLREESKRWTRGSQEVGGKLRGEWGSLIQGARECQGFELFEKNI